MVLKLSHTTMASCMTKASLVQNDLEIGMEIVFVRGFCLRKMKLQISFLSNKIITFL